MASNTSIRMRRLFRWQLSFGILTLMSLITPSTSTSGRILAKAASSASYCSFFGRKLAERSPPLRYNKLRGGSADVRFEPISPEEVATIQEDVVRMWQVSQQESKVDQERGMRSSRISEISDLEAKAVLEEEDNKFQAQARAEATTVDVEATTANPLAPSCSAVAPAPPTEALSACDQVKPVSMAAAPLEAAAAAPSASEFVTDDLAPPMPLSSRQSSQPPTAVVMQGAANGASVQRETPMANLRKLRAQLDQVDHPPSLSIVPALPSRRPPCTPLACSACPPISLPCPALPSLPFLSFLVCKGCSFPAGCLTPQRPSRQTGASLGRCIL